MKLFDRNKIIERSVSIQSITDWTILVATSYSIGEILVKNQIVSHLILWLIGALVIGYGLFRYYQADYKGDGSEKAKFGSLIYRAMLETSPDSAAATDLLGN